MVLTNQDMVELVAFRHKLHRMPELSREEVQTAQEIRAVLAATNPDRLIAGLGGHGIAAVYEGAQPGPTVMIRAATWYSDDCPGGVTPVVAVTCHWPNASGERLSVATPLLIGAGPGSMSVGSVLVIETVPLDRLVTWLFAPSTMTTFTWNSTPLI